MRECPRVREQDHKCRNEKKNNSSKAGNNRTCFLKTHKKCLGYFFFSQTRIMNIKSQQKRK